MDIDSSIKKFKINRYKIYRGKRILKDTTALLKNIYVKRKKLERKYHKIKHTGNKEKEQEVEEQITELSSLHEQVMKLPMNGIIEVYSNC